MVKAYFACLSEPFRILNSAQLKFENSLRLQVPILDDYLPNPDCPAKD